MAALSTAIAQTLQRTRRPGAHTAPGESPLFGLSSADQIDMYVEPQLLEKAGQAGGGGPMSALDSIGSHMLDGLSAQLDTSALAGGAFGQGGSSGAAHAQQREGPLVFVDDAPGGDAAGPGAPADSLALDGSPLPPPRNTTRMAPRLPRRVAGGGASGNLRAGAGFRSEGDIDLAALSHAEGHGGGGEAGGGGADVARHALARASRPGGPLHFLLVNAEPLMLMTQTALIQSISLEHAITRAGDADEAIAKLKGGSHGAVDVLLVGPVRAPARLVQAHALRAFRARESPCRTRARRAAVLEPRAALGICMEGAASASARAA